LDTGGVGDDGGTREAPLAVDIVITNYNYGAFIAEAIESALDQTHPGVNVIVVDDGSTDDSAEVIRSYGDRVEAVLKENGRQASAINAGFDRCKGEIAMVLDADDVMKHGTVARVAEAFAANPEVVRVQFRMDIVDRDGVSTGATKPAPHLPMPSGDMRRAELAFPFDLTWMATGGNAFRLRELRRVLPIPEQRYPMCADWYLVHTTALLGPVLSLDDIGVSYRMHGGNNYEPQAANLDLDHIRETIGVAATTADELASLADRLELDRPRQILSLADLAYRMISLRLSPETHPVAGDSRRALLAGAVRAARRRFDVRLPMKAMYLAWFAAMAVSPRPLCRWLAELFLFPERRRPVNSLLGRLQRAGRDEPVPR
jgi:hypothetical protein